MTLRARVSFAALLGGLLSQGCAGTTLYSGRPPGTTAPGYDQRWHPAFFFGAVPLWDFYDLSKICREGWAELRFEPDAFTVLSSLMTAFIYSPSRLTIVCAAKEPAAPPELPQYGRAR